MARRCGREGGQSLFCSARRDLRREGETEGCFLLLNHKGEPVISSPNSLAREPVDVDGVLEEVYPAIQGGAYTVEVESITEKLYEGMDVLAKGVDGFFQGVLTSRDTLLSSLRFDNKTVNDRGSVGRNMDQQVFN
ncbi:protein BPS1 chloroplastic-like [Sesbania bispinosa]|nr:protein BPS1 chloroplastic-like [Sesbania bispinosa]